MAYRRVLLKLSGEALNGRSGLRQSIRPSCSRIASDCWLRLLALAPSWGHRGGWSHLPRLKGSAAGMSVPRLITCGMLATVMNAITCKMPGARGVWPPGETASTCQEFCGAYIRRRAHSPPGKGRVVVFGAGCGNPFFNQRHAGALRGRARNKPMCVQATRWMASTTGPAHHPNARPFTHPHLSDVSAVSSAVMDSTAIAPLQGQLIPHRCFDLFGLQGISAGAVAATIAQHHSARLARLSPIATSWKWNIEASMRSPLEATQRNLHTNPHGRATLPCSTKLSRVYGAETNLCVPWLHFDPDSQTIQIPSRSIVGSMALN